MEYWLKGPIPEIPDLLQPVAHALLQVRKELKELMVDFDESNLWIRPKGVASVGFHLQHLVGVLDRLFTYADGKALSENQLDYLKKEGVENMNITSEVLINNFDIQVERTLEILKKINPEVLTAARFVGRKQIASTVIGLIFHAAEHTTRHFGQLLVTVKTLQA